ncbi:rhodanese-like domain-containing protein [Phormidium sp. CLA17]|uniref:rhodanese-like domain-containing protein n=1 Tax=Leptolyngbya sp. Cla-17 TaxID=2803751 RepID=UPI001492DE59|nr:rhodanese-like domain-containing protein [Leptolyngbya sp. Cla-17]MBM0743436.1 rhodanese-like domain-containing protein [Leptolyngbya sp. Cla-17]
MGDSEEFHPLVLDARSEEEYAVSHLIGARRIDINSVPIEQVLKASRNQAIVIYCSIGYRSAKVVQQLQHAGFNQVFNLEGGLFQWANEDRPLVHAGQPTQRVHPYNAVWGVLIERRHTEPGRVE